MAGFLEALRGLKSQQSIYPLHPENITPRMLELVQARDLGRDILERSRMTALNTLNFFTRGSSTLKIDSQVGNLLMYFITEREANILSLESPLASDWIQNQISPEYDKLILEDTKRVNPKKRTAIVRAHRYLRLAAETMRYTYAYDLSLSEEDEGRTKVKALIKQYAKTLDLRPRSKTSRLLTYAAVAAVGYAAGMAINTVREHVNNVNQTAVVESKAPQPIPLSQVDADLKSAITTPEPTLDNKHIK